VIPVVVVDASVIVKWLLPEEAQEDDTDAALSILADFRNGKLLLREPPHWLAEVTGVLTRLCPGTVDRDITDLHAMNVEVVSSVDVYRQASRLARSLNQHLFDTLYHAVALATPGSTLITADHRYFRKAASRGALTLLAQWRHQSARGS
jgi:predicted nucleic acid-binding protein